MSDLIDTTEMYLRTVYELEEEGVVPLRARIAERLKQSGPTVSQTVARMERDGLVAVEGDRHLVLSPTGHSLAVAVMRKHRLAELLLIRIIGMDWEDVHTEACRWEHVMSEQVERKIYTLLDNPTECPHGNPIPGLADLGGIDPPTTPPTTATQLTTLRAAAVDGGASVVIRRISEQIQPDAAVMHALREAGLQPDQRVKVHPDKGGGVRANADGRPEATFDDVVATHVFVTAD